MHMCVNVCIQYGRVCLFMFLVVNLDKHIKALPCLEHVILSHTCVVTRTRDITRSNLKYNITIYINDLFCNQVYMGIIKRHTIHCTHKNNCTYYKINCLFECMHSCLCTHPL